MHQYISVYNNNWFKTNLPRTICLCASNEQLFGEISPENLTESAIWTCHLWHRCPITDRKYDVEGIYNKPSHMLNLDRFIKIFSSSSDGTCT